MSYYKYIKGIRYERSLLEKAATLQSGSTSRQLGMTELQSLYQQALDRRRITPTEKRTLLYIVDTMKVADEAREWLLQQPDFHGSEELGIQELIRGKLDLDRITWVIDPVEASSQVNAYPEISFIQVLEHALNSFLFDQGTGFIGMKDIANKDEATEPVRTGIKAKVNSGTLYLLPKARRKWPQLTFELPFKGIAEGTEESHWLFGLEIPGLNALRFLARVRRTDAFSVYQAYFSKKSPTEERVNFVLQQLLGLGKTTWVIPGNQANEQEWAYPKNRQGWELALFLSLDRGIYNGESSLSFWDHLTEELWPDPELSRRAYIRRYLDRGFQLFFLPELDPEDPRFPLPENRDLDLDSFWYFGLAFPGQTDIRVLLSKARTGRGADDSWNDAFVIGPADMDTEATRIIQQDFGLSSFSWHLDPTEVQKQHEAYDPWWRHSASVLRQALNTYIEDYLTPGSLFYYVSQIHREDLAEDDFDSEEKYRAAVRGKVREYMHSGILHLVPLHIYDLSEDDREDVSPPPNGEAFESYWLFQLRLPGLGDPLFYACIPRWPSFEEGEGRPYNYGVE